MLVLVLFKDYTEKCLKLEDAILEKVENINGEQHIYVSLPIKEHACPRCGATTKKIKDYYNQKIKDLEANGDRVFIHVHKRRYVCKECCKTFFEENSFLTRYKRATQRFYIKIISETQSMQTFTQIAARYHVSITHVRNLFKVISYPRPTLPAIISIDEFKGNANGERFQCILTNPETHEVLDILPSRDPEQLRAYFLKFSRKERANVDAIVMDMSTIFRSVAKDLFPDAQIVVDKFHLIRLITWALDKVRRRIQKKMDSYNRKDFKRSKSLLLKPNHKLSTEDKLVVNRMLNMSPDLSHAYALKEAFYNVFKSSNSTEAKTALGKWVWYAEKIGLYEFRSCKRTITQWFKGISNIFEYNVSNGFTEGYNNKIKVLKRISYGYRSFDTFRNRILFIQTIKRADTNYSVSA